MGEEDPIQFYRISLTITNDANLTKTSFVDLFPRTVSLKFDATFSGVLIAIDGEEFETPNEFIGVVGMEITIAAVISGMIEKGFFFQLLKCICCSKIQHLSSLLGLMVEQRVIT